MAVLSNTMLQGTAAVSDEESYQIEKSVRFNAADDPHLQELVPKEGNRRKWTFSIWVKRSKFDTENYFYTARGGLAYTFQLGFDDDALYWYNTSDPAVSAKTNALFRDPSAWYHVVFVWDTAQAQTVERVKLYVNGKRITSFSSATYPPQYEPSQGQGALGSHEIGSYDNGDYYNFDGYIAEPQFIDGMALSPAAFGKWDDAGCWQPKAFELPAINKNQDYSDASNWSTSTGTLSNIDKAFKGTFGVWGPSLSASASSLVTFTPDSEIDCNIGVEIGNWGAQGQIYINKGLSDQVQVPLTNSYAIHVPGPTSRKIKNIALDCTSGTCALTGIKVDGIELIDNQTDSTTLNNPNNGLEWSSGTEAGTALGANDDADNAFDGTIDDSYSMLSATGATYSVTLPSPVTVKHRVRLHCHTGSSSAYAKAYITPTGGSNTAYSTSGPADATGGWKELFTGTGELTKVEVVADGSNRAGIQAVEVDDHILIDKTVDNSFHLKFNDTTKDRYLGKDTLNGKIADATGGLPIYNTTDDYGDVKGSGYRTDSSAGTTDGTGLIFAWPGDTTTGEVHASINTGSSAKTVTANGDPSVDTDNSRLYGSSVAFDRTGDYLSVDGGTDFNFGTGDYTIECWFMTTDNSVNQGIFVLSDTSGGLATDESAHITAMIGNDLQVRPGDGTTTAIWEGKPSNNTWHHIALTRESGTFRAFYDGGLMYTKTGVTTSHADQYLAIGGYYSTSYLWKGNIQDFRIYKGTAKYTASFTALTRNDFTVNDITAGEETANAVFNWRPKASLTDDASAEDYAISNTGTTQSTTSYTQKAHTSTITRTSGTQGQIKYDYWTATPPGNGVNGGMIYGGRSDTQWTFSPAVVSPSGNITARVDQNGGSTGADKIRFYDGSSWTAWFDVSASNSYNWTNIATGVSTVEKVEFDCGGSTDSNLAGFYLNGGTADSDWWMWRNGEDFGITQAGWFEKDNGDAIITDSAVTIPSNYTIDYWACPEFSQKGNGTIIDTATEQTIRDYGSSATGNGTMSRTLKITSTNGNTVYDFPYTTRAGRWHHVRITNNGVWVNGTQKQNSQSSNYNVPDISGSSHRIVIGNYTVNGGTSYSFNGLIGPVRIIDANLGAPPAGGLVIDEESGSSSDTPTNNPVTNTEVEYDVLVESPTNYKPAVGSDVTGGVTRGNYATMNPLTNLDYGYGSWTLLQGNLYAKAADGSDTRLAATIGASSGKWYWEVEELSTLNSSGIGINKEPNDYHATWNGTGDAVIYQSSGDKHINGTSSAYGNSYTKGDIIGVQWDADNGAIYFWKNGTIQNSGTAARTGMSGIYTPILVSSSSGNAAEYNINFGQRAFKYTNAGSNRPSADYKCLCTQNLPDTFSGEEVNNPSKYFDIKLYTGDDTTDGSKKIKSSFSPDLAWLKCRSTGYDHRVFDRIRGQGSLTANKAEPEYSDAWSSLTTFDDDGISIEETAGETYNSDGETYVAWLWDAGTAAITASTDGSTTPTAQWVNATAGFSMGTFTGDGSSATIGHELSATPEFIILKNYGAGAGWYVYHHKAYDETDALVLNTTAASDDSSYWNDTAPTNTVYTAGPGVNSTNNGTYIWYAWTPISGYSSFGQYIGNGDENGPFVYTGFRVKYLLQKRIDSTSNWQIMDVVRDDDHDGPGNPIKRRLKAEGHDAEFDGISTDTNFDFLANGFKVRDTDSGCNANNGVYVYAAFASHPLKTARAL